MNDPILDDLNPQQLEAVTAPDGPLLIIAGAGTGKTRVITRRIANLVRNRGVRPYQIFAVTFTNRAAAEMKRRVMELVPGINPSDFHIATFHSLCARILRREASAAGLSRDFTICDERDQLTAVRHVIKALGLEKEVKPADAQWVINQAKIRMLGPEDVGQVTRSPLEDTYAAVFEGYDKYLRDQQACDFEDLILNVVKLFRTCPNVLADYHRRYHHVLVDEYQDTNAVQFEFIQLLASGHRNLTVVGDEDQSIYSWRGAEIHNLLDFQQHFPDARLVKLEQNYRSTGNILHVAGQLIANNRERVGKTLFTEGSDGPPVFFASTPSDSMESHTVVDAIVTLVRECGYSYGDCAIFYRASSLSRLFEDRLRQYNVPYRVVGGIRFYDRAEIKDLLSYLQVAQNPSSSIALLRIINTPKRGIGDKSVQAIIDYARKHGMSEFQAMQSPEARMLLPKTAVKPVERLVALIQDWQEHARTRSVGELLERILDETDYVAGMGDPNSFEVRARAENIEELQNAVTQFGRENPGASLQDYLENVSLVASSADESEQNNSVSLMTLHSAKGLEFKVVFIVALEEGIFPNQRAVYEENRLEEERRLFYVGLTRAREVLVITRSGARTHYGSYESTIPSSFLNELPFDRIQLLETEELVRAVEACEPKTGEAPPAQAESQRIIPPIPPPLRAAPPQHSRDSKYHLGQKVRHPLLGEGIIAGISGAGSSETLIIQGDGKTHKLLARYANLEILE